MLEISVKISLSIRSIRKLRSLGKRKIISAIIIKEENRMTKDELNDLLWIGRKLVSGLIGPDMWKYLAHKDETDSDCISMIMEHISITKET